MMNKKYVILGGGSAGWMTAISIKKMFPLASVTVIQSKSVGIIGVGEATTPHIVNFLNHHDIDPLEIVRQTNGTIKNGISFENWNGDGNQYFHSFFENIQKFRIPGIFEHSCEDFYKKTLIAKGLPFNEYLYQQRLAYSGKVDLTNTTWAIHFDATKFANALEDHAKIRGINVVEGNFKNCIQNENGFIKTIVLENNQEVDCDFVFDCTGFARLLIGKVFKEEWVSYNKFLPAKQAIPFWLESEPKIHPYTKSIAMKYGWMWNIPLQHRLGAGYVFDSDYVSIDQAKEEVEKYLGQEIEVRKVIDFEAGRHKNVWVKNCMAVGLSANFIEPLESTSLWLTQTQLLLFKQFINEIDNPTDKGLELFNKIIGNEVDEKSYFVYIHYLTKRTDSEFWKNFKENNPVPDALKSKLELIKNSSIKKYDIEDALTPSIFPLHSYLEVCGGLGLFEKPMNITNYENITPSPNEYKELINKVIQTVPTHQELLTHLQKGKP